MRNIQLVDLKGYTKFDFHDNRLRVESKIRIISF